MSAEQISMSLCLAVFIENAAETPFFDYASYVDCVHAFRS